MLVFVNITLLGSVAWVVWLYFDFYLPKSLNVLKVLQKYPFVSLCAFWVIMLCLCGISVHFNTSTQSTNILQNIENKPPLINDLLNTLG